MLNSSKVNLVESDMSLQPLVAWWPDRATGSHKTWQQRQRWIKRSFKRRLQAGAKYLRRQYYLPNALRDSYRAFKRNEDIAWGGLMLMAGLSFAAISVLANATYNFVMAASVLSTISGANLALMAGAAITVVAVLSLWLLAFTQTIWTYTLYEGSTGKQNKSLRQTVRRALGGAGQVASAWGLLLLTATVPAAALNGSLLMIARSFHLKLAANPPLVAGLQIIVCAWAVWVLANYSLLPHVAVLEHPGSWWATAQKARRLVDRKGRLFTLSTYLSGLTALGAAYLAALGIQAITNTSSILSFLLLSLVPLTAINAAMTMLYRKRQMARS